MLRGGASGAIYTAPPSEQNWHRSSSTLSDNRSKPAADFSYHIYLTCEESIVVVFRAASILDHNSLLTQFSDHVSKKHVRSIY